MNIPLQMSSSYAVKTKEQQFVIRLCKNKSLTKDAKKKANTSHALKRRKIHFVISPWDVVRHDLGPVYMEWGTPVQWGRFLLFCVRQSVKTKETYPTRPGSPTPCKQGLRESVCHKSYMIGQFIRLKFLLAPEYNSHY